MELGLTTFGEVGDGAQAETRLAHVLAEAELTEQVGLDVYAVGEHHRDDFAISAPPVVLAAIAARTRRIRLASAVTVLSSEDPVRVFEQFATLDLLSHGRAEIWAGRGSFTESFALFGQDLRDYDELFAEKLELLLLLREHERVTWSGRFRAPLDGAAIQPRPVQDPLPVWIAVGGTPESVARAGLLGLPLVIAIIGGEPARFAPLVDLYHRAAAHERPPGTPVPPLAVNAHGFIAPTREQAMEAFWPGYRAAMTRIGRERGWPPITRAQYAHACGPDGHLCVGTPEEVTAKLLRQHGHLRYDRYLLQFTVGPVPHADVLRSIELFGREVAPVVRSATADPELAAAHDRQA